MKIYTDKYRVELDSLACKGMPQHQQLIVSSFSRETLLFFWSSSSSNDYLANRHSLKYAEIYVNFLANSICVCIGTLYVFSKVCLLAIIFLFMNIYYKATCCRSWNAIHFIGKIIMWIARTYSKICKFIFFFC